MIIIFIFSSFIFLFDYSKWKVNPALLHSNGILLVKKSPYKDEKYKKVVGSFEKQPQNPQVQKNYH